VAERLSEVETRLGSVRQLSSVITAMRGIAAARSREAESRLAGVRHYAGTVGMAIGQALALLNDGSNHGSTAGEAPHRRGNPDASHLVIALTAEQGFAGGFNVRVLQAVERLLAQAPAGRGECLLVGDRGAMTANERGLPFTEVLPMVTHSDQVPGLADRIAQRLFERARKGLLGRLTLVYALPSSARAGDLAQSRLLPFDYSGFERAPRNQPPLITLPPQALLARLTDEYLFAQLCEALLFSHAAENEARVRAMVAARDNVARKLDELTARARLLRQEQITGEVVELAAGVQAGVR
jgi:F-type H+-transporting ATPase subunit gamma